MELAAPQFQTEYCRWARPLKTGMCLLPETADLVSRVSKSVCLRARILVCLRVLGVSKLCNDKGWSECDKCFFFCLLVRSVCYLTTTPNQKKKPQTRAHGHPRHVQNPFSLQPFIRLFTALLLPFGLLLHRRALVRMYSLTALPTHTHTEFVVKVWTCRIAAAQWWTSWVGPEKTLESA